MYELLRIITKKWHFINEIYFVKKFFNSCHVQKVLKMLKLVIFKSIYLVFSAFNPFWAFNTKGLVWLYEIRIIPLWTNYLLSELITIFLFFLGGGQKELKWFIALKKIISALSISPILR